MLPTSKAAFSHSHRHSQLNVTNSSAVLSSSGEETLRLLALMKAMPKGEKKKNCAFP